MIAVVLVIGAVPAVVGCRPSSPAGGSQAEPACPLRCRPTDPCNSTMRNEPTTVRRALKPCQTKFAQGGAFAVACIGQHAFGELADEFDPLSVRVVAERLVLALTACAPNMRLAGLASLRTRHRS